MKDETTRCERCGWPYAASANEGCRPGNCSMRPLPELRPGRDGSGGYDPLALAEHLYGLARAKRAEADRLDVAARSITESGLMSLLEPE